MSMMSCDSASDLYSTERAWGDVNKCIVPNVDTAYIGYSDSAGNQKVPLWAIVNLSYDFQYKKILFGTKKRIKLSM